jgi:hypothetical protein
LVGEEDMMIEEDKEEEMEKSEREGDWGAVNTGREKGQAR